MATEYLSSTGAQWLITKLKTELGTKQDAVSGKGLSTNDLTNALKTSYDGAVTSAASLVSAGAEANKINTISVNGSNVAPDSNKNVNLAVATASSVTTQIEAYGYQTASQVTTAITGYGYQTASQVTTKITSYGYQTSAQVQSAINSAVSGITGIDFQIVTSLPTTGTKGVIYLIAHAHSDAGDSYDEYIWLTATSTYEKIGNTDVDLSGYMKATDITEITTSELEAMWSAS